MINFKEPRSDKAMKGHLIRKERVPSEGSCRVMCYMEPDCVSINIRPGKDGKYDCELNDATEEKRALHNKKNYVYLGIENPCISNPCFNNGICQAGYTEKGFRCKCPIGFMGPFCRKACSFDFEDGIDGWKKNGTAFNNQPTFGDNPTARGREPAKQQGDWWIGGAEVRPSPDYPEGKNQGDRALGTLTSPCFRIVGKNISFLIGGGCRGSFVWAELIVNNQVVRTEVGNCLETMFRKSWDVQDLIGQNARVRLVDENPGNYPWGHINFDDLKGDIDCSPD